MSLFLATWPAMGERERDALNEEVGGSWWNCVEVKFWKSLEFLENGKACGCGGRKEIKKKEKGKEIINEDIFSWI